MAKKREDEIPDSIDFDNSPDIFEVRGKDPNSQYYWAKDDKTFGLEEYRRRGYVIEDSPEVVAQFAKGDSQTAKIIQGTEQERYILMKRPKELAKREELANKQKGIGRLKSIHADVPRGAQAYGEIRYGKDVIFSKR